MARVPVPAQNLFLIRRAQSGPTQHRLTHDVHRPRSLVATQLQAASLEWKRYSSPTPIPRLFRTCACPSSSSQRPAVHPTQTIGGGKFPPHAETNEPCVPGRRKAPKPPPPMYIIALSPCLPLPSPCVTARGRGTQECRPRTVVDTSVPLRRM